MKLLVTSSLRQHPQDHHAPPTYDSISRLVLVSTVERFIGHDSRNFLRRDPNESCSTSKAGGGSSPIPWGPSHF